MAFSTTTAEKFIKKGVTKITVALNDTAGDSGAFQLPDAIHVTLQVNGTFAGGAVKLQCSNDGTNWYDCPSGLSVSVAGVFALEEVDRGFLHYRLDLASGGATTTLTCVLICLLRSTGSM